MIHSLYIPDLQLDNLNEIIINHKNLNNYAYMPYVHINTYCKRQKLSERKILWFTGFHTNVVFALSVWNVLKKDIAELNIYQENFRDSSKICENRKFSLFNFCHLPYVHMHTYIHTYTHNTYIIMVLVKGNVTNNH